MYPHSLRFTAWVSIHCMDDLFALRALSPLPCTYIHCMGFNSLHGSRVHCVPIESSLCNSYITRYYLQEHIRACSYKRMKCPHRINGCLELLKEHQMEFHLKKCRFKPPTCQYCNQVSKTSINLKYVKFHLNLGIIYSS